MEMSAYRIREDHSVGTIDPRKMTSDWFTDDSVYWVDVLAPTVDDVRRFLEPLELHRAITAACTDASDTPRVIMFERYLYMVFPFSRAGNQTSCLRFLCGPTAIVSFHADALPEVIVAEESADAVSAKQGSLVEDYLIYLLVALGNVGLAALAYWFYR